MPSPITTPQYVYKVAAADVYDASIAAGRFVGQPIDHADGYIHFSSAEQLGETIRLYFAGLASQVLFQVPVEPFGEALRWESSRGGALFPHLYGELPMDAVCNVAYVDVPADGILRLPEWVR
jgi:uncharacterized protein (DUF952 family)